MCKMVDIIFAMVVYNNYTDTLDCVSSVRKMLVSDGAIECVIIDNSDKKEIIDKIEKLEVMFDFVKVLRPSKNLGYFGAFNFFFEAYTNLKNKFVILCNNDLVFDANFCEELRKANYGEEILVVCPDVVTLDGRHQNPHVLSPRSSLQRLKLDLYFSHFYVACLLRIIQKVGRFVIKPKINYDWKSPCYLHMGIGACYVLLPSFLRRFKHLEFPHFIYGEEAYLSKQVHDVGGKLYYDPNLKMLHKESVTLSKLPRKKTYEFGREGYWDYRKFY